MNTVLFLGEGDFSFSREFCVAFPRINIVSTTFADFSRQTDQFSARKMSNVEFIRSSGGAALCNIDARCLRGKTRRDLDRQLLRDFFLSVKDVCDERTYISVALRDGQAGSTYESSNRGKDSLQIIDQAANGGFVLVCCRLFKEFWDRINYTTSGYRDSSKPFMLDGSKTYIFIYRPLILSFQPLNINQIPPQLSFAAIICDYLKVEFGDIDPKVVIITQSSATTVDCVVRIPSASADGTRIINALNELFGSAVDRLSFSESDSFLKKDSNDSHVLSLLALFDYLYIHDWRLMFIENPILRPSESKLSFKQFLQRAHKESDLEKHVSSGLLLYEDRYLTRDTISLLSSRSSPQYLLSSGFEQLPRYTLYISVWHQQDLTPDVLVHRTSETVFPVLWKLICSVSCTDVYENMESTDEQQRHSICMCFEVCAVDCALSKQNLSNIVLPELRRLLETVNGIYGCR